MKMLLPFSLLTPVALLAAIWFVTFEAPIPQGEEPAAVLVAGDGTPIPPVR